MAQQSTAFVLAIIGPLLAISTGGCDDKTTFRQVPLSGVPQCDQSGGLNLLKQPLTVSIKHDDGHLQQVLTGAEDLPKVSLPMDERQFEIRVGRCSAATDPSSPSYSCGSPNWLGEAKTVELDPTSKTATIALDTQLSGEHPCWR